MYLIGGIYMKKLPLSIALLSSLTLTLTSCSSVHHEYLIEIMTEHLEWEDDPESLKIDYINWVEGEVYEDWLDKNVITVYYEIRWDCRTENGGYDGYEIMYAYYDTEFKNSYSITYGFWLLRDSYWDLEDTYEALLEDDANKSGSLSEREISNLIEAVI